MTMRRTPREIRRPGRHGFVRAADGAGNEAGVGGEVLLGPHIDERGAVRDADQARKLFDGYGVE